MLNILAKDLTATLQKGDKFALLPDQYWYEIRFGEVATGPEVPANGEVTSTGVTLRVRTMEEVNSGPIPDASVVVAGEKRKNSGEDSEADSSKRHRSEATEDGVVTSNQNPEEEAAAAAALESPSFEATTPTVVKPDPDGEENEAAEGSSGAAGPKPPQPDAAPAVEVKKETADSTGPPVRPSCQFGIACYRHTADHRAEFAHPHDVDYRRPAFPPAADDAPHCPFGAACYRRNPQHFREYQHPDSSEYAGTFHFRFHFHSWHNWKFISILITFNNEIFEKLEIKFYLTAKYVPRIGQLPTTGDGDDSDQDDNGAARPQRNVRQPAKLGDYVIY